MEKTANQNGDFISRRMRIRGLGILSKSVIFSWAISVGTIIIFAAAITTGHRSESLRYFYSKAQLLAAFIENTEADRIVREGHGAVQDNCAKMVGAGNSIRFIAITRKDGMSVVHLPTGTAVRQLGALWTRAGFERTRLSLRPRS
jgi:hypothetical protein